MHLSTYSLFNLGVPSMTNSGLNTFKACNINYSKSHTWLNSFIYLEVHRMPMLNELPILLIHSNEIHNMHMRILPLSLSSGKLTHKLPMQHFIRSNDLAVRHAMDDLDLDVVEGCVQVLHRLLNPSFVGRCSWECSVVEPFVADELFNRLVLGILLYLYHEAAHVGNIALRIGHFYRRCCCEA